VCGEKDDWSGLGTSDLVEFSTEDSDASVKNMGGSDNVGLIFEGDAEELM